MKSLKYCEAYQNVTQRQKINKCYCRNVVIELAWGRVATNFEFDKKEHNNYNAP